MKKSDWLVGVLIPLITLFIGAYVNQQVNEYYNDKRNTNQSSVQTQLHNQEQDAAIKFNEELNKKDIQALQLTLDEHKQEIKSVNDKLDSIIPAVAEIKAILTNSNCRPIKNAN